jgi:hypothetical protein
MTFLIVVGMLLLLYAFMRLSARVTELGERLRVYEETSQVVSRPAVAHTEEWEEPAAVSSVHYTPVTFSDVAAGVSMPVPPPPSPQGTSLYTPAAYQSMSQNSQPEPEFFLVTWFKEQTLIKIGALIFFLGVVWFVSYSMSRNWIPASTPVYLGLCIAVGCYVAGVWRREFELVQYIVLTTLGTGVVLATVCTAQFVYHPALFPAAIALVLMFMSLVYTVRVSLEVQAEWLTIASALAGFFVPYVLDVTTSNVLLFVYLFIITSGLSLVVFFTRWRVLSLVLVVGCSLFELSAATDKMPGHINASALWFFMVLFAGLFTATTTVSLFRSAEPEPVDITLLLIVGLLYAYGAHTLSLFPSLAFFAAAFLLAGVGYVLSGMEAPKRVVAVYVCFASALWLLGTGQIFTNHTELMAVAFTVEITAAFLLLSGLRLSERAVYLSLASFAIPFFITLPLLYTASWNAGIWHADALVTTLLAFALLGSALWVLERPQIRREAWAMPIAGTFASVGFLYTLLLLMQVAVSSVEFGSVFGYVLWFGFMYLCFYYTLGTKLSTVWSGVVFVSMLMPIFLSIKSIASPAWDTDGVLHPDAIGVYTILGFCTLVTIFCFLTYRYTQNLAYKTFTISALIVTTLYSFLVVDVFWHALFTDETAVVLTYCSYALILYGLFIASFKSLTPQKYTYMVTIAGVLPVLMSLSSMRIAVWGGSILQPQAAGLYVMTALLVVMGIRFLSTLSDDEAAVLFARRFGVALLVGAGIYATIIIWLISHVLFSLESMAVTIALLVYTVAGLGLYVEGSRRAVASIKYSGMSLLAVVVLHLGLVDVWQMTDQLPRIGTFLGIGFMFMLAALLEKKKI